MTLTSGRASARLAITGTLVAATACAFAPSAGAASSYAPFKLDARKGTRAVSTPKPLARGTQYIATVQGTFAYYGASTWVARTPCGAFVRPMYKSPGVRNTFAGTDPEFTFALPGNEREACGSLPYDFGAFQISTGGRFTDRVPIGGKPLAPNRAHRYRYLLKGTGKRARFRLWDGYTEDNYGVARISVRPAPKGFKAPVPTPIPAPMPAPAAAPAP